MKKSGVNCVRMHYPQNPALLALYDEIGFLVMEEVPLNWWGQKWWPGREAPQSMDILQPASAALTAMIRRDRNHPCVFAWSMANESATQTEVGQAVMRALLQEARRLDPSRLATFVVAGDARPHLAAAEADILCTNIYYGLHQKPAAHHRNQLHELVYTPSRRHLEEQAAAFPGKPVLVTEFGMRGIKGVHGDVAFSEDFQADYLACMLQVLADSPDVAGGMLWSWADYYHRRELIDYAVFGPYGMVTVDRAPKAALKVLAAGYRAIRPTRRKDG